MTQQNFNEGAKKVLESLTAVQVSSIDKTSTSLFKVLQRSVGDQITAEKKKSFLIHCFAKQPDNWLCILRKSRAKKKKSARPDRANDEERSASNLQTL